MKPVRSLRVRREVLADLTAGELDRVVAAAYRGMMSDCFTDYNRCETRYELECVNDYTFEYCPIATLPIEECLA